MSVTAARAAGVVGSGDGSVRVGLLTADAAHPLLAGTAALLEAAGHRVETLSPTAEPPAEPAQVYLLKARTPSAIALARTLERRGIPVVNTAAATEFCQDRVWMARRAEHAGLPFAATTAWPDIGALRSWLGPVTGPLPRALVVKSHRSRRDDLVTRVTEGAELAALQELWPNEPVITQEWMPGTGWDHKLWVVAGRVFAALRRSEFASGTTLPDQPLPGPHPWSELALRVGAVFGLEVYGVDLLEVDGQPVIIDVNAFPGMRGQDGAAEALAAHALTSAQCPREAIAARR
ncbi:hypothetical protein JK358_30390 [Nocardia sp. 2]|uniref:ATP-grasp fold RimK-type domain-containing protein n=1 Tax=Nocardia acididurans TaxID=2802282 RepID=A0ABS1MF79_9NOCA|nr:hypothetical protein [Nocardia acididurans]MBL1078720.1 hypothetical protein [Nocardia acididurans]